MSSNFRATHDDQARLWFVWSERHQGRVLTCDTQAEAERAADSMNEYDTTPAPAVDAEALGRVLDCFEVYTDEFGIRSITHKWWRLNVDDLEQAKAVAAALTAGAEKEGERE